MNYENTKLATLNVFHKFNVISFPIDCKDILKQYGMKVEAYSEQKLSKQKRCLTYSDDAFTLKNTVYYNDNKPTGRIRFSLAHEIGHIALEHTNPGTEIQEREADLFASYLLAPRMAIHYAGCKNQNDVAKLFNISQEAAQYAFDDYRRWHRWTIHHKMNGFDKAMYSHFYNDDANCFVYHIKRCAYCDAPIYNSNEIICRKCNSTNHAYLKYEQPDDDLMIAESQWLYGGL